MINMKAAKKKATMAVGMILGVTMLAGAAFASYTTMGGYEAGKTAFKGLADNENYTANSEIKLTVDGKEIAKASTEELYDRDGDVKLSRKDVSDSYVDYISPVGRSESETYVQDNTSISIYTNKDGKKASTVYDGKAYFRKGAFNILGDAGEKDKESSAKIIRFAELLCDTLVGDLKNNIVYVSGDDNTSTYEINLDAVQIPELANAGLEAMFTSVSRFDTDDPFMILGSSPIVKNASLRFSVDSQNRLTEGKANVTLSGSDASGENHEASVDIAVTMSDYGTTTPRRVDVSTLPNPRKYHVTSSEDGSYMISELVDEDGNVIGYTSDGDVEINEVND